MVQRCGDAALYSFGVTHYKDPVDNAPTIVLVLILLLLLMVIAFSAGTEVALLSVNRYRIRHRAGLGERRAKLLEKLLAQPDRWLGANLVILALASVAATTVATLLAQRTGHPLVLPLMMIVLTELAPKIFAAVHSESVALGSAYIYLVLLWVSTPVVWVSNHMAQGFLRLIGVTRRTHATQALS